MTIIKFSSIWQNFGKNVNFENFQISSECSENCVFISKYSYMISVMFLTFFFAFGKVTDSQSFKYKEFVVSGAKLFFRSTYIYTSERTGRSPSSVVCCFSAFYINILFNLHQTCAGPTLFEVGMLLYSAYTTVRHDILRRSLRHMMPLIGNEIAENKILWRAVGTTKY